VQPTTRRRRAPAAVLALVAVSALLTGPAAEADRPSGPAEPRPKIVKTKKIAPGLTYTKIVEKKIPRRTYVLRIDLRKVLTLDVTLARPQLPARRVLSEIVKRAGALAGVNGDYGGNAGRPVHPLAQDGYLLSTSDQLGTLFGFTRDESSTGFGKPALSVTVSDTSADRVFTIDRWNEGPPAPGEIAGFSPLGGTLESPPPFACSVRMLPATGPTPSSGDGVDQDFNVDVAQCSEEPLPRNGGIVLSAAPATDEATQLLALAPGTPMRLHWTLGWTNVFDAIGGAPLLLLDGAITGQCNSGCGPQPRTGVGVTASGKILLVVVDGRQAKWSLGPTVDEFARIMRDLGAVTALNLDGGGSSTMVVKGQIVNRPSDGHERSISSALLVLPDADPGEPAS
jgi:hypothetical protein